MAYVANFEGILKEEKNFWGKSDMADLLGISWTRTYPKTRKFLGRTKTAPKNALISLSRAQILHTPNICDFLRNSYRTNVLTISLKKTQKCFYKVKFRKIHPYLTSHPKKSPLHYEKWGQNGLWEGAKIVIIGHFFDF